MESDLLNQPAENQAAKPIRYLMFQIMNKSEIMKKKYICFYVLCW